MLQIAILNVFQNTRKRAGPWEPAPEDKVEEFPKPCSPCMVPLPVSCLGGHEVSSSIRLVHYVKLFYRSLSDTSDL